MASSIDPCVTKFFETGDGRAPFGEWLSTLDPKTASRIFKRLAKVRSGNLGDFENIGGVLELKEDFGPGYRIYIGVADRQLIILLAGGAKRSQNSDIATARAYWASYKNEAEMSNENTNFDSYLEDWLKQPGNAAQYLMDIINDDDEGMDEALIVGLKDVVSAFGVAEIARKANINRQHLYRILDGKSSPRLSTLRAILAAVGACLTVKSQLESQASHSAATGEEWPWKGGADLFSYKVFTPEVKNARPFYLSLRRLNYQTSPEATFQTANPSRDFAYEVA